MALVGTRMNRDAVGAERLAVNRHTAHIRHILAACIAESRHLIDIDTKIGCHKYFS